MSSHELFTAEEADFLYNEFFAAEPESGFGMAGTDEGDSPSVLSVIGEGITRLPERMVETVGEMWRGGEDEYGDRLARSREEPDAYLQKYGNDDREVGLGFKVRDFAGAMDSVPNSLTNMVAGIGAGATTTAVAGPAAGWAVGTGVTGGTAYRATKEQFVQDYFDAVNEEYKTAYGRPVSEQEWANARKLIEENATEYGLWEALPEAVGSAVGLGTILGKLNKFLPKNVVARLGSQWGITQAEEQLTETMTGYGQGGVEAEVGLRDKAPTVTEAFKEQAPSTFLLTNIMGGGVKVGQMAVDALKPKAKAESAVGDTADEVLEEEPENIISDAGSPSEKMKSGVPVDLLEDNEGELDSEKRQGVMTSKRQDEPESKSLAASEAVPDVKLDTPQQLGTNQVPFAGSELLNIEQTLPQQREVDSTFGVVRQQSTEQSPVQLPNDVVETYPRESVQPVQAVNPQAEIVIPPENPGGSEINVPESLPAPAGVQALERQDAMPSNIQNVPEHSGAEIALQIPQQQVLPEQKTEAAGVPDPEKPINHENVFKKSGLELKQASNSKGDFWVVTGETYNNKQALKEAGAKWNRAEKGWAFYQEESPLQEIAEQLDRLPASLGGTNIEPVDRSTYDENSKRTTKETRLYEEQLRKEYGLDFPDGSVFAVRRVSAQLSSKDRAVEEGVAGTDGISGTGRDRRGVGNISELSPIHSEVGDRRVQKTARNGRGSKKQELNESHMLDSIAGLFGKKIVYVASDLPILPAEAHADLNQKIIFMRPDANAPHLFLLGHEVIHLMKKESPALYDKLYDLVQIQSVEERWDDHYRRRDRLERMAGREAGLTRAQADEELIADFSGEQFMDPDFWEELAAEEPNQFRQVAKKIKKLIDRILSVFTRSTRDTRYFHDIELVRKGLVSVLAEYSRQQDAKPSSRHDVKASKRNDGIHFSKTSNPRNHTSTRNVRGAVQGLQARAENALPLEVVSVFEDLPEHIRKAFKAQGGGYCEACNDPKTGKVWMVAENIASRKRAVELWLHEQGAHHGLRGLMGDKDYLSLLGKVHRAAKREAAYNEVVEDYGLDISVQADRDVAAHEYLAKLAEKVRLDEVLNSREKSIWRKVVDAVLNWLTRIRVKLPGSLTRPEINRLVADAVFWTVQGESVADIKSGEAAPSYSRSNPVLKSAKSKIGPKGESKSPIAERISRIREFMRTELNQGMFDRFASLKDLDQAAGIEGVQESAYVAARMSTSHADQIAAVIEHGHPIWREGAMDVEGEGLARIFEPVAAELDRFTSWMVGLRARKLMDEGRENLFSKDEIDELCKLNEGRATKYEDVRQNYIQFKTKVLDFAEAAGIVSGSGRLVWEHDEYIPFYRINDETADVKAPKGKKGIASQYSGIRRLQGGTANLGDPFENIIRNFSHLIDASVKNNAMEQAMTNAEKIGEAVPADFKWQALKLKGGALRSALVKTLGDDKAVGQLTAAQRDSLQTVFRMVAPDAKDVVHVLRDGKPVYYHVGDPLLLRSLTAVNAQSWNNMGMKAARFFKRLLTTGVTSTPDFMLRNIVRDTVHAWGVDRTGTFKPLVGSFKGTIKTMRKDEDTVKMMAAGAAFHGGYSYGHDPGAGKLVVEKLVKKHDIDESTILDTPEKLGKFMKYGWDRWQEFGSAFENATRARLYEGVKEKGGTHLEAAYEAKDIMDYSMGGDWPAIRFLCETVPFFGARMVGLHRLGRGAYENPQAFLTKGAMVALASVLLYLNNRDRDEFKELEHWDRDNYYHFFISDKHFRMPKPFEIGAIFGTLPERLTEFAVDGQDGDLLADRLQFMLTQTFNVGTPQIITPVIEQWADKSFFTGRSIVPMRLQRLRPEAQRDHRTSETAALLGEKTGTSPKRIEHLVNGYFGTLGVYVLSMSDVITRRMVDAPEMPSRRLDDMPLIKSFYRDKPARHSRYLTELYDMVHEADELYLTVMAYSKSGSPEKAKQLLQDKDNRKLLAKRPALNQLRRAIGEFEKGIRQVHLSRTLTPDQKRERIDRLLEKRNGVVRRVMGD
ncbi:LPD38 domain-containing protein [Maridesulfovibrio sp.]|uniref:LPD38 domain-containing protein n=1 Tax=Maridesulfovibrio sp. TaxID=2795000 RepID=UPI0029F4D6EA|nr:LPD38 domain-containing protein [Maridesulfovibrio sp.]